MPLLSHLKLHRQRPYFQIWSHTEVLGMGMLTGICVDTIYLITLTDQRMRNQEVCELGPQSACMSIQIKFYEYIA